MTHIKPRTYIAVFALSLLCVSAARGQLAVDLSASWTDDNSLNYGVSYDWNLIRLSMGGMSVARGLNSDYHFEYERTRVVHSSDGRQVPPDSSGVAEGFETRAYASVMVVQTYTLGPVAVVSAAGPLYDGRHHLFGMRVQTGVGIPRRISLGVHFGIFPNNQNVIGAIVSWG